MRKDWKRRTKLVSFCAYRLTCHSSLLNNSKLSPATKHLTINRERMSRRQRYEPTQRDKCNYLFYLNTLSNSSINFYPRQSHEHFGKYRAF